MKTIFIQVFLFGLFSTAIFAQIEQTHPELCAREQGAVPPLPGMSVSVDETQGSAKLFLGDSRAGIDLPGVIDSVPQVCPLPNGLYLLFSEPYYSTNMVIVDATKRSVVDDVIGFDPTMSPDQRWIAYRKFYSRQHDANFRGIPAV